MLDTEQEGNCGRLQQRDSLDVPGTAVTANLAHPHHKFYNAKLSLCSDKHFREIKVTFSPGHSTGKRAGL